MSNYARTPKQERLFLPPFPSIFLSLSIGLSLSPSVSLFLVCLSLNSQSSLLLRVATRRKATEELIPKAPATQTHEQITQTQTYQQVNRTLSHARSHTQLLIHETQTKRQFTARQTAEHHTDTTTGRQADRQPERQAEMQAGGRAGRQAGIKNKHAVRKNSGLMKTRWHIQKDGQ
jgi:hypothetical protein